MLRFNYSANLRQYANLTLQLVGASFAAAPRLGMELGFVAHALLNPDGHSGHYVQEPCIFWKEQGF